MTDTPTAAHLATLERLVEALEENNALLALIDDLRAENTKLRRRNNHRGNPPRQERKTRS